jgi:hypothetical protein
MLTPDDLSRLAALATLYTKTKALIIYDPDSKANIAIYNELRIAFDHVMRVIAKRHSGGCPVDEAYFRVNLDKATGHVYRAAFDALDGACVSLKFLICDALKDYPSDVIGVVMPNYWEMKIKINELSQNIGNYRSQKDIGNDLMRETFSKYVEDMDLLRSFYKRILDSGSAMSELKKEVESKENRKAARNKRDMLLTATVAAIIGAAIGAVMGAAIMHFQR